jgi:polysaccharide biosynthesis transport protein
MAQYEMSLRDYQRVLRKRYKIIVFTTVMLAFFSYWFASTTVPIYSATASIKIDDKTGNLANTLLTSYSYNVWDNLATQMEIMRSFDSIERVGKTLGKIPETVPSDEVRRSDRYIRVIRGIQASIGTQQNGNTNIVDISVSSVTPEEARDVANTVALVFRETHRESKQSQATETTNFIEDQLAACEIRLKAAEDSLKSFQLTMRVPEIETNARDAIDRYNKLELEYNELTESIDQVDLEISQLIQRRDQARILSLAEQDNPGKVSIFIDWVSSIDQESQTLALMNNNLVNLEFEKMDKLLYYNAEHPQVQDIEVKIQTLVSQLIREYTARVGVLRERQRQLAALLAAARGKLEGLPDAQRRFVRFQRDVRLQEDVLALLLQRQQEMLIRKEDISDDVSVVKYATLPDGPTNANTNQVVVTGLVVGLLLGLVLAFVFETLDTSIGTIEDVEEYLDLPVLGIIPHIDIEEMIVEKHPHLENDPQLTYYSRLISLFAPKTPVSESYRTLRTNLSFSGVASEKPIKTIVFTSSSLQEGKSTTLANLAIVTAQMGKRTLLVGCNLRRPSLYKTFGIKRTPGITDVILGSIPWEDCVQNVTDIMVGSFGVPEVLTASGLDNLYIIEAGQTPPNPSELLSSPQMERFLKEAAEEFDLVYIDMPPTLPVTDSSILGPKADGVVLIYQVGRVPRNALKRAKTQLQQVGANVVGVVLNDVRAEITGFHPATEYFIHYYGEDAGKQPQGKISGLIDDIKQEVSPMSRNSLDDDDSNRGLLKRFGGLFGILVGAVAIVWLLMILFGSDPEPESGSNGGAPDGVGLSSGVGDSDADMTDADLNDASSITGVVSGAQSLETGMLLPAVITVPTISVRDGPGSTYRQIGTAIEGERVPIVNEEQRWYRIVLGDGRVGWIPTAAATVDTTTE